MSEFLSTDDAMDAMMDVDDDVIDVSDEVEQEDTDEADDIQAEFDDVDGPEEATESEDDEGEPVEPETPAIDAPKYLDATEREAFSSLPTEAQQMLVRQSQLADKHFTNKSQEIAQKSKALDTQLQQLGNVVSERETKLQEWSEVPWQQLADTDPAEYIKYKAAYDADLQEYHALKQKQDQAVMAKMQAHIQDVRQQLPTVWPELAKSDKPQEVLNELQTALIQNGVSQERIDGLSAYEMRLLYNGIRFEQAQTKKTTLRPKSDAKTTAKPFRARGKASSLSKRGKKTDNFRKAPTRQNAMAALMDIED